MTDDTFKELVNLYLDKEISERGLVELKAELARNAERKREFAERCQLHQATRLAMNPGVAKRRSSASNSASKRAGRSSRTGSMAGSRSSRSGAAPVSTRVQDSRAHFPRWILGGGLAACLAVGFALLTPVFRDTTHIASQPELVGVEADELMEVDPLDTIGRKEFRRFASIQEQRAANQRASLAAQLRLMGLRPELTPEEKQLRSVSLASIQPRSSRRNHAELLEAMRQMTPIPAPQILRVETNAVESTPRWPGGFHSSLASFK